MATMDDQAKQAFTAASDWSKQIMTLSTAILTLTVAFSDSVFGDLSNSGMWLLVIAWLLYVVSILGGFLVLIALNEALVDHTPVVPTDVYRARKWAHVQAVPFVGGTFVIMLFGLVNAVG